MEAGPVWSPPCARSAGCRSGKAVHNCPFQPTALLCSALRCTPGPRPPQAIRREAPRIGGSFAVWGGLFSTFDCTLVALRKKEDPWNSIAAGALTGEQCRLLWREGVQRARLERRRGRHASRRGSLLPLPCGAASISSPGHARAESC